MTLNIGEKAESRFPTRCVETKTGIISYRESGSSNERVILLLHGIGSASGSWLGQLDNLSAEYHVVAWDSPGYGSSTALIKDRPDAIDYANVFLDFLSSLKIIPHIIIGHSLGALMAGAYAANNGVINLALILANPANGYGAADKSERDSKLSIRLASMEALGPKGLAETRSSALLSANASSEALELVRWNMSKLSVKGHSQAAHMLASGNLMVDASRYFGPVLVMCGPADTVTPEDRSKKIASTYPNGYYQSLPGVGHASYVENPTLFNSTVIKFLESLDA